MFRDNRCGLLAVTLLLASGVPGVYADTVAIDSGTLSSPTTQSGTLASESQILEDSFSVSSYSRVTAFTTSYGGGTNLDGSTTAAGGLQPNLTLYTSGGQYVASQAVSSPIASQDSMTGLTLDSYLTKTDLAPGSYLLVLTDWLNQQSPTSTNLADGFANLNGSTFTDEMLNARNGNYTLNVSSEAVPEPGTIALVAPVLLLALGLIRRSRSHGCS